MYGSSRLGVHEANVPISTRSFNAKYLSVSPLSAQLLTPTGSIPASVYAGWATFAWPCTTSTSITPVTVTLKRYGLVRGQKKYELANHLGNVLAVITDRKIQDPTGGYLPCVASYSDYYPFGWEMPGRSSAAGATRYGFNGKENDVETGFQDYGLRQYDRRQGRFISVDPLSFDYPWNSTYAFAENDVIRCIDLEGAEKLVVVVFYTNDAVLHPEKRNEFNDTRLALQAKGYTVLTVSSGKEMIENLSLSQKVHGPTQRLVILSHGFGSVGVVAECSDSGIYSDVALSSAEGYYERTLEAECERGTRNDGTDLNPNLGEPSGEAAMLSDVSNAVQSGKIKFTPDAITVFGGCSIARSQELIQCDLENCLRYDDFPSILSRYIQRNFAAEAAKAFNTDVIAGSPGYVPNKPCIGNTTTGQVGSVNGTSMRNGNEWYRYTPSGKETFLGKGKLDMDVK